MALEILRGKSAYVYRINPWNDRIIDRRLNKHNERWQHFQAYATPEDARAALLTLEKEATP